jgi:hypothetical protein
MSIYQIGTSAGSMASLESLGLPIPKASAVDHSVYLTLGDDSERGMGCLTCEWRFAVLTVTQYNILKVYAGTAYIETLQEAGTYARYSALMLLPPRRPPKVDFYSDLVVRFRKMVAL